MANITIDSITVEVIGNSFASIVEEMGEALIKASYSPNIKERRDCSTALFDKNGNVLCQAEHIPMHLGSFLDFIPKIHEVFGNDEIESGDAFIGNDPYVGGGTHLPDIVLAEPVFLEMELIGWAINTAHHSDYADRSHAHIFQEGLRIPPVRLYRKGQLVEDVRRLILINCQVPAERLSDLRAQMAANRLGVSRLIGLCRKYGADVVLASGEALQDYAERKMRAGISQIPDGEYRFSDFLDWEDSEQELELSVAITVTGDEMKLEFDCPEQIRWHLNVVFTGLLATVYYAVKTVVDPTALPNAGLARPLTIIAPEGSLLNCVAPAAVDGRIAPCQRVVDLIYGALHQAVPERVTAASNGTCGGPTFNGRTRDKRDWVYDESIGGGMGARHNKDGLDGVHVHMTNTSNLPVEALEGEYPITVLKYELVDGSGGAGKFRGGMGIRRVYRAEEDCRVKIQGSRFKSRPWGLNGGLSAGLASYSVEGDAAKFEKGSGPLKAGDVIEIVTPGGGGYGDPSERPAEQVVKDVAERRITAARAREIYKHQVTLEIEQQ